MSAVNSREQNKLQGKTVSNYKTLKVIGLSSYLFPSADFVLGDSVLPVLPKWCVRLDRDAPDCVWLEALRGSTNGIMCTAAAKACNSLDFKLLYPGKPYTATRARNNRIKFLSFMTWGNLSTCCWKKSNF